MHVKALQAIKSFSNPIKKELGELLFKLQIGVVLAMPYSKPMPGLGQGVCELRLKDSAGIYRVFYFTKSADGILVFHAW